MLTNYVCSGVSETFALSAWTSPSCHFSSTEPAPRPQNMSKIVQHPHPNHTHSTQRPHQRHPVCHAQTLVHGVRPQHAAERNHGFGKPVPAEQRGRELRVPERDVYEDALQDQDGAARDESHADGGDHEVDRRSRRPCEYEEADGDEEGGYQGWEQAVLGRQGLAGTETLVDYEVNIESVGDSGDRDGDDDCEEHEPYLARVHAVDFAIDEWEEFEERVEYGI